MGMKNFLEQSLSLWYFILPTDSVRVRSNITVINITFTLEIYSDLVEEQSSHDRSLGAKRKVAVYVIVASFHMSRWRVIDHEHDWKSKYYSSDALKKYSKIFKTNKQNKKCFKRKIQSIFFFLWNECWALRENFFKENNFHVLKVNLLIVLLKFYKTNT